MAYASLPVILLDVDSFRLICSHSTAKAQPGSSVKRRRPMCERWGRRAKLGCSRSCTMLKLYGLARHMDPLPCAATEPAVTRWPFLLWRGRHTEQKSTGKVCKWLVSTRLVQPQRQQRHGACSVLRQ